MPRTATTVRGIANRWVRLRREASFSRAVFPSANRSILGTADAVRSSRHLVRPTRAFHEAATAASKSTNDDTTDVFELEDDSDNDSDDEDYYGEEEEQPWKSLLELPARAGWRASDAHPPEAVMRAREGVLTAGGATAKQIRRSYADIVTTHKALALRRERERRRIINRSHYSRNARSRDEDILPVLYGRIETLAFLRNRLRSNYAITKRVLEETQSLLGKKWRPKRVIDMGIGVGCASAAALEAFEDDIEWIHGVDPSRCMRECSKSFLEEIMQEMTTKSNSQERRVNPPRLTLGGSIATETSSSTFDLALMTYTATELPQVASTLAAAAILWQKLSPDGIFILIEPGTPDGFNTIRAVRNMLLDCCPPEDANENEDAVLDQCHIIAPCTHNGKCPMERYQHDFLRQKNPKTQMDFPKHEEESGSDQGDDEWDNDFHQLSLGALGEEGMASSKKARTDMTDETELLGGRFCSFVQTTSSGSHFKKGEKFSYLVAQKRSPRATDGEQDDAESPFQNDRLRDLLANVYEANEDPRKGDRRGLEAQQRRVQDLFEEAQALETKYLDSDEDDLGLELVQGDTNRSSYGRIIRAPIKKKGHVYVDYCAAPGRLMRSRITKSLDYGVAPGLYTAARKSRWGGLWPDVAAAMEKSTTTSEEEEPGKIGLKKQKE